MSKAKRWTREKAIDVLHREGAIQITEGGMILRIPKQGFSGLTACSAYDFLRRE